MKSCVDWFTIALPDIYDTSRKNAVIHNRNYVTYNDILIGIKRYKMGYDGFAPPEIVLSVFNHVIKSEENQVYNQPCSM